jgi:hypothetical protein
MASPYIPAMRYMSPSSFISLPPPIPVRVAEVYFVIGVDAKDASDVVDALEAAEVVRVKGEVSAVDRRKGLEEAGTGTTGGAMAVDWIGGSDGGCTEAGLPPGVKARVIPRPAPLDAGTGRD